MQKDLIENEWGQGHWTQQSMFKYIFKRNLRKWLPLFYDLTFEKEVQYSIIQYGSDTVVWSKLLVLCCHGGTSMHLGSKYISASTDRSNIGQEYKGAFPDVTLWEIH